MWVNLEPKWWILIIVRCSAIHHLVSSGQTRGEDASSLITVDKPCHHHENGIEDDNKELKASELNAFWMC